MSKDNLYLRLVKALLPSPFTIAIFLTVLTVMLALILTEAPAPARQPYLLTLLGYWQQGFWELLTFTMQMALILVLGHTLALSKPVDRLIGWIAGYCHTTARAALLISLSTLVVSLLNWGLCLIFGAVLVRKVGEKAVTANRPLNYALLGAAGYCGMMAWHGGFSGSAPLKVNEPDHFLHQQIGQIGISETLFSPLNITVSIALLVLVPALFYWLGKRNPVAESPKLSSSSGPDMHITLSGAERLDYARWPGLVIGLLMLSMALYSVYSFVMQGKDVTYLINLNLINFVLFGLCLALHQRIHHFLHAAAEAMKGATGILIQFPLYAGIMGVMKSSGLIVLLSEWFVQISTVTTFPLLTLLSAGLVNTFVPSGGGQWGVQGPVIVQAAQSLGVPISKAIMALAYGDQLTNMLQPFWALPLLGITRLSAKALLPYTLLVMLLGLLIFAGALLIF